MENKYLVSPEEQIIIDNQTSQCETVYYDANVSLRPRCQTVRNNRFQQNFSSLNLPSSQTLQIPNLSIVDTIIYRIVLPNLPVDVNLPLGWGYLLLNRLDVRIGSSTVLTFNKHQLLIDTLSKCDEVAKQDAVLNLGGAPYNDTINPQPITARNVAVCFLDGIISRIRQASAKLPFDTNCLTQPCQFVLYLDSASSIMGGAGAKPSQMLDGSFHVSQLDFKNSMDSLKGELMMMPETEYNHFFVYQQHLNQQFTGSTSVNSPVNLTLTGFRYGTLLKVRFMCVQNNYITPAGANDPKNVFLGDRVSNVNLIYNGQVLHRNLDSTHELFQMANRHLPPKANYQLYGRTGPNLTSTPQDSYWVELDISQFASELSEGHLQSGLAIGQNVLNLQFNTQTSNTYTIFLSYEFNSAIQVSNGGGEVDFVF